MGARVRPCNLRKLVVLGKRIWVRVPVVPGYSDKASNIVAIGKYVAELRHIEAVTLLPYHKLGIGKYGQLGMRYSIGELGPPAEEQMASLCESLSHITGGIPVDVG